VTCRLDIAIPSKVIKTKFVLTFSRAASCNERVSFGERFLFAKNCEITEWIGLQELCWSCPSPPTPIDPIEVWCCFPGSLLLGNRYAARSRWTLKFHLPRSDLRSRSQEIVRVFDELRIRISLTEVRLLTTTRFSAGANRFIFQLRQDGVEKF